MAQLLSAFGTSFSPLLALPAEDWTEYCKGDLRRKYNLRDGTSLSYDQLKDRNGDKFASRATFFIPRSDNFRPAGGW